MLIIMSFSNFPFEGKDKGGHDELVKENYYLKAQVEALTNEKALHITQHAEEKEAMKQHLRQLQERVVFERNRYRKDIHELTLQLHSLKNSVDKMIEIRYANPFADIDSNENNSQQPDIKNITNSKTKVKGKGDLVRGHQFSLAYREEEE